MIFQEFDVITVVIIESMLQKFYYVKKYIISQETTKNYLL